MMSSMVTSNETFIHVYWVHLIISSDYIFLLSVPYAGALSNGWAMFCTVEVSRIFHYSVDKGEVNDLNPFTKKVIEIIQSIPEGRIMTYGQIARMASNPRGARQVVRILHSMSRAYDLPWHRVVNAKGEVAIKDDEGHFVQVATLKSEGIQLDENGLIDIEKYRWDPIENDL